jgi:DNA-binding NarL/FixJ family response regulator
MGEIMIVRTAVTLAPHPLWLEALGGLLQRIGVGDVWRATSPPTALELVEKHAPDLFVSDLDVDDGSLDIWECLRSVKELQPEIKTVVVSERAQERSIEAAFAAGADVFCTKTAEPDDLAAAIRQAFDRSIFLARSHVGQSAIDLSAPSGLRNGSDVDLTRRELEILQLVAEGYSNSQLARMLWVTEQTVKFHLSNIYRKLEVSNRTEASRWAQVQGLLPATRAELSAA